MQLWSLLRCQKKQRIKCGAGEIYNAIFVLELNFVLYPPMYVECCFGVTPVKSTNYGSDTISEKLMEILVGLFQTQLYIESK